MNLMLQLLPIAMTSFTRHLATRLREASVGPWKGQECRDRADACEFAVWVL